MNKDSANEVLQQAEIKEDQPPQFKITIINQKFIRLKLFLFKVINRVFPWLKSFYALPFIEEEKQKAFEFDQAVGERLQEAFATAVWCVRNSVENTINEYSFVVTDVSIKEHEGTYTYAIHLKDTSTNENYCYPLEDFLVEFEPQKKLAVTKPH